RGSAWAPPYSSASATAGAARYVARGRAGARKRKAREVRNAPDSPPVQRGSDRPVGWTLVFLADEPALADVLIDAPLEHVLPERAFVLQPCFLHDAPGRRVADHVQAVDAVQL